MIPLQDLKVYKASMEIGELVWEIVERWSLFAKETLGKQLVRSADSIALNIAEVTEDFFIRKIKTFVFIVEVPAKKRSPP